MEVYFGTRLISAGGWCFTNQYARNVHSACTVSSEYEDTYLVYYYPDGPNEREIDINFYLGSSVWKAGFNMSDFLEAVGVQINVAVDRMVLRSANNITNSYGQHQAQVTVRESHTTRPAPVTGTCTYSTGALR